MLQTKTTFSFSEARYKKMRTEILTMDKNEVRFLFSIYNISKKHCISLLLKKLITFWLTCPQKPPYWPRVNSWKLGRERKIEQIGQRNRYQATLHPWRQFHWNETNALITVLISFSKTSRTRMEEHADTKWNQPGWRIEQKYDTDVLIGNWNEERRVVG